MKKIPYLSKNIFFFVMSLVFICEVCIARAESRPVVAPLNPSFVDTISRGIEFRGVVPSPFKLRKHEPTRLITSLPSRYDLRDVNLVTPVKDQDPYGACWAFATCGALESDLLVNGSRFYDFSENNIINKSGFDIAYDSGGNAYISVAYMSSGKGPVSEMCDPYGGASSDDCPRMMYIENAVFLPGRQSYNDNDYIKEAIYKYGAVYTSMYYDAAFYNPSTNTYYYNGQNYANHAVTIVGWDDNKVVPGAPSPGAWIVKNSWGDDWGENGYFYVSYRDSVIAYDDNVYFVNLPDINNGIFSIHQYDELGPVTGMTCPNQSYIYGANIFEATEDEDIVAVSFFTWEGLVSYTIEIYVGTDSSNVINGNPLAVKQGFVKYPGFYTVKLDSPVHLLAGTKFTVMVKFNAPGVGYYPLALEERVQGWTSKAVGEPGQSFISCDKQNWNDVYGTYFQDWGVTNVSIKAIAVSTMNATMTHFSDVSPDYWFYNYVMDAYAFTFFSGYPDGTFKPNNPITRAELATVLARAFDLDLKPCLDKPYPDVDVNAWYCEYIEAVKSAGLSDVDSGGNFDPDRPATRAEAMMMFENGLAVEYGIPKPSNFTCEDAPFPDIDIDDPYCYSIYLAKMQGIISGYPDGLFYSNNNITRSEMAKILTLSYSNFMQDESVYNAGYLLERLDGKGVQLLGNCTLNVVNIDDLKFELVNCENPDFDGVYRFVEDNGTLKLVSSGEDNDDDDVNLDIFFLFNGENRCVVCGYDPDEDDISCMSADLPQ